MATSAVSSITKYTAVCGGAVGNDGGFTVSKRGVCYSLTNTSPTLADAKTEDGDGAGMFTSTITGLEAGKKYYVKAYATNEKGTGYGSTLTFETLPAEVPVVETQATVANISFTSATASGKITDANGSPIQQRGFCFSKTNTLPTVADSKVSESASTTGDFSMALTGLDTGALYHFRAYATNAAGTGYGAVYTLTTSYSPYTYLPVVNFERKVLIENYTGHTLGNGPSANQEAERLKSVYSGRVFVMSLHIGFFAKPLTLPSGAFASDFRTSTGNALESHFEMEAAGLPKGAVQRKHYPLSSLDWETKVTSIMAEASPGVGLRTNPTFSSTTGSVTNYVHAVFSQAFPAEVKAACYLVEDSVVTWQKHYGHTPEDRPDYVHMHVLRGALAPVDDSEAVGPATGVAAGFDYKKVWTLTLPAGINPAHAKVIAILYRADTREVLQVTEERLL